ncbi:reverse transcriptase domain-containing protein [Tanacetum coccineum]
MTTPVEKRNNNKFYEFHGEVGHNTDKCMHLKRQIVELLKARKLPHVIKELKQNSEKDQPKTNKKGEASNKDKALAILMIQPWKRVARQRITQSFSPDPKISFPALGEEEETEGPMIIEAEIGGHFIHRMYVDGCLRNAGAMYQRLVDKAFHKKIDKNLEDVQKLNGKLASLNSFLAKSTEKSIPFFKTLKKYTKKSDFHWTEEAESVFKQMKQLIAKLAMLIAPEEKEELIVYLAATKEAVSAVLMTKREAKQMLIYFVSHALRGPEVNYTSMEKLVLALVHAILLLKRHFQAQPIIVVTDQPIKQVLSRPEVAGRLQKWSIELGEYAIHYRPRVSVKGQILANFIVERPEEDYPDTLMEVEEELLEPWILFTDGSSCADGYRAGLILTNPEGT